MTNFFEQNNLAWFKGLDYYETSREFTDATITFIRNGTERVELSFDGERLIFTAGSMGTVQLLGTTVTVPGLSTTVCVYEAQLRLSDTPATGNYQARIRGRDWPSGSWSAWTSWVNSAVDGYSQNPFRWLELYSLAGIAALSIRDGAVGDGDFVPSARIGLSGFAANAQLPMDTGDAWDFIQSTTSQVLGAAGLDEDGKFFFIGKDRLRGVSNSSVEQIGVDGLADLPWSISGDDVADRVTVAYTPVVDVNLWNATQTVWEATEVIQIAAGATRTITADLDGVAAELFGDWLYDDNFTATTGSRWHVYRTREGTDTVVPSGNELRISTEQVTASQVRIRITNTTAVTLYIRDESGGPYLILRARNTSRRGETQTVEVGAAAADAVEPFDHDGGMSIQTFEDAQSLAAWLYSVLSQPLPVLESVEVVPNPARRIGQVVTVFDPVFTGIRARAIIAGVSQSGAAGSYKQTLKLALLAVTVDDAMSFAETLTSTNTIGALFDAIETLATSKGVATTSIEDLIDFWDPESVVIE